MDMSIKMSAGIRFQVHNGTSVKMYTKQMDNVSREPDFRYTTILLSKMKENDKT